MIRMALSPALRTQARRCDRIAQSAKGLPLAAIAVSVAALGIWSALTQIDGITRSSGAVVPFNQNQTVQHLEGGIVSEILVREGDKVQAGQVLVRIRDAQSIATLQQTQTQLWAKRATLARLDAELKPDAAITFPADIPEGFILASEREFFAQRRRDQAEQLLILEDKIRQHEISLSGLVARRSNLQREREWTSQRTASLRRLNQLGAASRNDMLQGETALQQIDTKITDLSHDIPQTESALSEAVRQRNGLTLKFRSEAFEERTKLLVEISQITESVTNLREKATRTDIRAPTSGTINKQLVSTIGGVIAPGAPIMEIVPISETIAIEAQLSPQDRAEIWPGTKAIVKITAYDYSIYGGLEAQVIDISPDIIREKDGQPFFRVRLNASNRLGDKHPIIPGMVANVDMITRRQTVLQYLLTPLLNVRDMAFRR